MQQKLKAALDREGISALFSRAAVIPCGSWLMRFLRQLMVYYLIARFIIGVCIAACCVRIEIDPSMFNVDWTASPAGAVTWDQFQRMRANGTAPTLPNATLDPSFPYAGGSGRRALMDIAAALFGGGKDGGEGGEL